MRQRISSGSIAVGAWKDGFASIGAMPGVALTAFLALTLINLTMQFWHPAPDTATINSDMNVLADSAKNGFFALGSALIEALLLTPFAIAVHRFILLQERTSSYRIEFGVRRFRRFALYTFLLQLIALSPAGMMFLAAALAKTMPPAAMVLLILGVCLAVIAGSIVVIVLMVRLILLFPAVAVDAPRAGWNRALDESTGRFWRILFTMFLTGMIGTPVLIVAALAQMAGAYLTTQGQVALGILITSLVQAASNVLMAAAFVSAASWLYRDLGDPIAPEVLAAD